MVYSSLFLLSLCRRLKASDYHFGIFKPFYCLSVVDWRLLITTLVYSSLSIICRRLKAPDYHFGIFKPFYCLSVVDWRLLITTLVYSSLSIVCLSLNEGFWLPLWYIQAFLLSLCRRLKASDYHFGIFKPFYCLSVVDWRLLITTLVYSSLSIVCLSSNEGFWLLLWYIQAFLLSVCRPLKASDYHFGIFKHFYCLSVVDWRLLITTLVYSSLSIFCLSSIEGFWLPLWYIQAFLLSVCRRMKASDYHFGIFMPFYCLSVVDWRLLITTLVYSSLSIVCLSSIEGFWLLLCYIQAFLLSVCRPLKASDYHFGIFKPFYCLSFVDWRLLITTLVYSSLSIVCLSSIEGFWLPLWYIQALYCLSVIEWRLLITPLVYSSLSIVCLSSNEGFWLPLWYIQAFLLSLCRRLKASDYHFGIFKPFYCLFVVDWRLLITTFVYSSLSIVCLSSIEGFWLPLWYIQAFLLSVCRRLKTSGYHFGIFKPFYCLSVVHWRLLITTLVYSSLFLLSLCRRLKASDYHFGIFKPFYCLSVVDWRLLITTLVYSSLSIVCRRLKASDYHFGIFKPFYRLSVVHWRLLITTLVYSSLSIVFLSSIEGFWLPLWYIQAFLLSVCRRLKASDYHFDILKPFYCLSVVDWRLLITTLVYSSLSIVCLSSIEGFWLPLWYIQAFLLSVRCRMKASDYHFGIFKPFYCLSVVDWRLLITTLVYSSLSIVCLSSIEGSWLPLWYIQAFLLSVCRRLKASDYHIGIFKPFYCLFVVDWRLLITTLVYSSLSIVCLSSNEGFWLPLWYIQAFLLSLSSIEGFWLPLWYIQAFLLSVCRRLKASDYHFDIFKPFYCLSVVHWRLLITTVVYSSLSIVCLSSIEGSWLPRWYIQAFLLSVCRPLKASDYHFGIFKPFYCLSFVDWRLLITTLVYSSLSIVCLSSIEGFWLPLWYIQALYCLSVIEWRLLITTLVYSSLSIVCLSSIEGFWLPLWYIQAFLLSVCRRMKASDYHFGIFKPFYCLSVVDWRLLITTLVYSSLSIVCLSSIEGSWLPLLYIQAFLLSVCRRLKASDYHFGIFKPFYCLSVVDWRLLITTLVYSSLSIVCMSSIEGFWLPLWYIQAFLLSVCRPLKASDYHFGIFKPFYCMSVFDWRLLVTTLIYSSLSIVCLSSIEGFWLLLWYIQVFLLSVSRPLKASDYHFGIFKPFYCLSVVDWKLLITTLVYSSLSIVCLSSIEGFWLPLWYIQAFLLSVCRRLKASDYHFGIFKPFYCLSVVDWRLLITTLVYSSLSVVCLSSIEGFWLPLWYIQAFLLSVCRRIKASDYHFGIFKPFSIVSLSSIKGFWLPLWYIQAFLLSVCRRLKAPDYHFGIFKPFYYLSSIEGSWLPLWYIQAFLLSVCRRLKASDYYFGIFKPFYCLSVVEWRLLITTLVYSSLSIVSLSSIEGFWLPLWYIQAFLLSVCRRLKAPDYHFGIFKPFYCLSVVEWRLLITTLIYSSFSIVCLSSIEGFWLPLWYIQAFLLSVCRRLKASDYHFGIFKPFYFLSVVDWRLLITTLVYSSLSIVCLSSNEGFWLPLWYIHAFLLSVCRRLKAPDYHFGIFKPFYCLSVVDWRLLITTLLYSSFSIVCLSSIEGFWLPLWYIQAFLLSVFRRLKASDYHFGIFKPFYCLSVVDWRLLITTLVYSSPLLSVCHRMKASDYHFGIFKPFYCLSVVDWRLLITTLVYSSLSIVCLSSNEGFWLPLWYIQAFLLSLCRRLKASDYHFGIFKPFYCLFVVDWRLLITTFVYSSLSIVCLSSIEGFWLPLWYIQAFLLSVCRRLKTSGYHFGIFKPFYCLSVVHWRLLITTLVYSSLFLLSLCRRLKASDYHFGIFKPFYCLSVVDWRLLITTLVYSSLSIVCRRLKASDYHFGIFKPFYCLSVVDWRLLITTLVYSSLSIVCMSSIEGFWLPLWYIQAFLLSVCRPLKASDYHFGIFKPFYCLSVVDWRLLVTTLIYSSLSIVCLSSIEGFWLLLWYIQVFLLSVSRPLKASDYHFGIFKPFYCLSVVDWKLLITTLVYSSLSIVCLSSIEGFWLPLWYIQAFLLSVCRRLKASDYHFGIFKPFYCLSVVDWRLLITTLVYSSLSVVCLSSIEGFWLPLWYIQAFLLSVCRRIKASDYHFGIFKPFSIVSLSSIKGFWLPLWYIQAFLLSVCRRLKAPDYHFGIFKPFYYLSSIEGSWLPLWYIQAFLLSVCRRLKASDYYFGIFKPFYCLSVVEWRLLITTLVYSSLSIVSLSSIEGFWLPLWYIQAFLLSVCRRLKAPDYHFGIFKPFYCLSVVEWRLLITTLIYSSFSIVCLSSIEGFWLPLWYIQAFLLSVCRRLKASDYHFGIFKPFYFLSVVDWRLLITTLVYSSLSIVCLSSNEGFWLPLWYIHAFLLSVCRRLKAPDYHFGIFKPFYCLSVVDWRLLITTLLYSSFSIVCLSSIEGFWLPLWYIQAFLLSVFRRLKASDYHFGIFKPFYCLSVVDWRLLITTLVYSSPLLSVCHRMKASDYPFGIFKPFYCLSVVEWRLLITTLVYSSLSIVSLSSIEGFWLPLWYIQAFLLSVCRRLKAPDYHFCIFKPFYCLSVVDWRLLITTLVYSSLSIVCLSSIEDFWLPLWYIQAFLLSVCRPLKASDYHFGIFKPFSIVSLSSIKGFWLPLWYIQAFLLSVCRRLKASDYHFGIFKPFYCLSSIEGFWLPLWYIQAFLSSVCRPLKASDYHFGIFKPFYCLSVVHWRLLITTLVYSSLSIVCLSSIEGFWLPLWYTQAFLLSVCRRLKASDYHFGIFKPFYCLSVVDWRLLITTLVYSSLSIVCPLSNEGFWLPLWYIQAFLLSVCRRLKASDYHFGIFKPFYCLSVVDWRLLITTLVYSSLSIVCLSSIEGFWLPHWYIQAFLLSVCRRLKTPDYHFGIFKPFYCLSVVEWRLLITTLVYSSLSIVSVVHWRLLITTLVYSSLSIVCLSSIEGFWLPLWYIQAFLLSVCGPLKASDYHCGIFKPFYCLSVVDWRLLITTLVYSSLSIVCLSSIEGFWLPLWYIQAFLLSVFRRLKASDYHFGIFKPFYCLSVVDWRLLITTLVYSSPLLSVCHRMKASDYHFGIFKPFYCLSVVDWRLLITTLVYSSLSIVCLSSNEGFWLPLWYIQAFLLSLCRRLKASDYHFGIFKPFYCLFVVDWRLLITTFVYSSLSIVCLSSIEGFWLPLWYIQAFLLSVCRRLKTSDYHFGIFKPFYCLYVVHWRLLVTTLVYSSLSIVCLSSIEGFWLPLWYIQAFLLYVCRRLKASGYHFDILKPFYCLSVVDWRLLITTLVYSSLSIVCLSSIEGFWLPLWYIQAFLLSVCRRLKAPDYHVGIFKPFYCLSVVHWRLLITTLVYSSLSIVCLSSIEGFWLPLWYIQAFLLSLCRRLKASDYHFGIFKPFCCLSVVDWRLLITTLVYSSLSIVCLSSNKGFWLPLWYIQAFFYCLSVVD